MTDRDVIRASVDDLAERLQVDPPEGVRARLTDQIDRALRGHVEPRARLSREQRGLIRSEYDRGDSSYRQIARKYGVAPSTVLRVVKAQR